MVRVRPATHAGSWYSDDATRLKAQLSKYFTLASQLNTGLSVGNNDDVSKLVKGARVLIGPHAGFTYSGSRLAETFNVWDTSKVKRVFVLGPSHHVYFKSCALVSEYDEYETPLGNLPVDSEVISELVALRTSQGKPIFKYMNDEIDEEEHSFEMHAPFIYYRSHNLPQGVPSIIPIMISGADEALQNAVAEALLPYLEDEHNSFVISSDFCHWGSRFNYTKYVPVKSSRLTEEDVVNLRLSSHINPLDNPIYKSIEILDKEAMRIASTGSSLAWHHYISMTGNTICGQKPIGIILKLLEHYKGDSELAFNWIGYSQSSSVVKYYDSSVSYASGYVKL